MERELAAAVSQLDEHRARGAHLQASVERLERQCESLRTARDEAVREKEEAAEAAAAERERAIEEAVEAALEETRAEAAAEIEKLSDALKRLKSETEARQRALDDAGGASGALRAELAAAQEKVAQLERSAGLAAAREEALEEEVTQLKEAADEAAGAGAASRLKAFVEARAAEALQTGTLSGLDDGEDGVFTVFEGVAAMAGEDPADTARRTAMLAALLEKQRASVGGALGDLQMQVDEAMPAAAAATPKAARAG